MRLFAEKIFVFPLIAVGTLLPTLANASVTHVVPEPLSFTLLATGLAGLGAAEIIRRRRDKKDK